MIIPQTSSFVAHWQHVWDYLRRGFNIIPLLILTSFLLISCTGLNFGGSSSATPTIATPSHVPLAKLHWCGKPVLVFRDEGATSASTPTTGGTPIATTTPTVAASPTGTGTPATPTPTTLTDWSKVKPNLGFTVYLPPTLPRNTCLVSASGTLHDPIFGGSFTIGYLLPDHSSISLAEAPLRSQNPEFQCRPSNSTTPQASPTTRGGSTPTANQSPAPPSTQLCSGARGTTNIVFSAQGSSGDLTRFFDSLQPEVDWLPAS